LPAEEEESEMAYGLGSISGAAPDISKWFETTRAASALEHR
jgi:hypothetical protein